MTGAGAHLTGSSDHLTAGSDHSTERGDHLTLGPVYNVHLAPPQVLWLRVTGDRWANRALRTSRLYRNVVAGDHLTSLEAILGLLIGLF